jgi:hypothetical protein
LVAAGIEVGEEGIAGLEGICEEDKVDGFGVARFQFGTVEAFDGQAGFLGEVADEKLGLAERGGGDGFSLQIVDAFDVLADDDAIRPA